MKSFFIIIILLIFSNSSYSNKLNCTYYEDILVRYKLGSQYWKNEYFYNSDGTYTYSILMPNGDPYFGFDNVDGGCWFMKGETIYLGCEPPYNIQEYDYKNKKLYTPDDKEEETSEFEIKINEYQIRRMKGKKTIKCKNEISNLKSDDSINEENEDNSTNDSKSVKEKLLELKNLFDEGLITKEVYEKKQLEILEQ